MEPQRTQRSQRGSGADDPLTGKIIACAIEVHRNLGPGLLESAYEQCMAHELALRSMAFQIQVPMPVEYKSIRLDCGYRVDLVVQGQVIVELKSVEKLQSVHEAQLLTYMKLSGLGTGLLINFNERRLTDGVRRYKL